MADKALLEELIPIARAAGASILDVYAAQFEVRSKADASPSVPARPRSCRRPATRTARSRGRA